MTTLFGFLILSALSAAASGTAIIRAADYGEHWPFTVPEGVVECTPFGDGLQILTFTAAGKTYGHNGTARNLAKERG